MSETKVNTHKLFLTIDEETAWLFPRYNLKVSRGGEIRFRFGMMIKVLTQSKRRKRKDMSRENVTGMSAVREAHLHQDPPR